MPYADPEVRRAKQREYQQKWFATADNRRQQRESVKRRQAEVRLFIRTMKEETPCADCGKRYPAECMDFDHLPGNTKVGNVSTMLTSHSAPAVMREIAKCEIVCAICHRLRTTSRLHS